MCDFLRNKLPTHTLKYRYILTVGKEALWIPPELLSRGVGSLFVCQISAVLCGLAMIHGGGGPGVTAVHRRWYRCHRLATFWRAVLFARDPMWSPFEPPYLFLLLCQRHWIFIHSDTLVSQCSAPFPAWPAGPPYWCLLAPHGDVIRFSHPISISVYLCVQLFAYFVSFCILHG